MTLGVSANSTSSAAVPRDSNGSRLSQKNSDNTRTDEAAGRRAEKQAHAERAEAKASQVAKEVLDIEDVGEKAVESLKRIDTYA